MVDLSINNVTINVKKLLLLLWLKSEKDVEKWISSLLLTALVIILKLEKHAICVCGSQ